MTSDAPTAPLPEDGAGAERPERRESRRVSFVVWKGASHWNLRSSSREDDADDGGSDAERGGGDGDDDAGGGVDWGAEGDDPRGGDVKSAGDAAPPPPRPRRAARGRRSSAFVTSQRAGLWQAGAAMLEEERGRDRRRRTCRWAAAVAATMAVIIGMGCAFAALAMGRDGGASDGAEYPDRDLQGMLEEAEEVVVACGEDEFDEEGSECRRLCAEHDAMCCFEEGEDSCAEEEGRDCAVYAGCEALAELER